MGAFLLSCPREIDSIRASGRITRYKRIYG